MRVATALTGMATCAAGFLPTAAQAATAGQGLKAAPDATAPPQPYYLNVWFKTSVETYQVCGWHPGNAYRCTAWKDAQAWNSHFHVAFSVGGNPHSWDRGEIKVAWNGGAAGHWDECNTNGAYYGYVGSGDNPYYSANLTSANGGGIGDGIPEC